MVLFDWANKARAKARREGLEEGYKAGYAAALAELERTARPADSERSGDVNEENRPDSEGNGRPRRP